jgi:hypothetical protein
MAMTLLARAEATPASRSSVGAPGALFYGLTLVAMVVAVDANTRESLSMLLIAAPLWFVLASAWLLRLLVTGARRQWRFSAAGWTRWLAIPLIMGGVFFVTRTETLIDLRLNLSRDAMDKLAVDVLAGEQSEPGWVGLYNVNKLQLTGNGFRFVVDDSGLGRWGYAYATGAVPNFMTDDEEDAGLWTGPQFESIGDGWWRWTEGWD